MSKFTCAVQQLRDLAEDVRPFFTDGKPREGLDLPDNAPDQLEAAAAFLELAGKFSGHDRKRWICLAEEEIAWLELAGWLPAGVDKAEHWKKLKALIEAIPEGE